MWVKTIMWSAAITLFAIATPVRAQEYEQPQQMPQYEQQMPEQRQQPSKAPAAPQVNKEEEAAYKALSDSRAGDPSKQVQLGEQFAQKFPDSRYSPVVYSQLVAAYMATNQTDKMFTAGDKALQLNPDNVDVLSLLSMAIPRRVNSKTVDAPQQLQKAETYAKRAIELLVALQKPATADEMMFEKARNEKLSISHSGLGTVYYHRQNYAGAVTELSQAVQLAASPDPVDYYLLGNAHLSTNKFMEAADAYSRCSVTGPLTQQCKAREEEAKRKALTGGR